MKTEMHPIVVPAPAGHPYEAAHTHGSGPQVENRLKLAVGLTALILLVEVVGGVMANSLALLADAAHMLADVFALGLAWFALVQARRPADARRTFGYHRVGILTALLNAGSLLPISAWIIWEALGRFGAPPPVEGELMFVVAAVGLVANAIIGFALHGVAGASLNMRSALLHVLGDAASSGAVLVGAAVIAVTGWTQI